MKQKTKDKGYTIDNQPVKTRKERRYDLVKELDKEIMDVKDNTQEIEELSLCRFCGCMTKSIESYKEIMHPYKLVTFSICGKCKLPKDNTQEIEQKDKKQFEEKRVKISEPVHKVKSDNPAEVSSPAPSDIEEPAVIRAKLMGFLSKKDFPVNLVLPLSCYLTNYEKSVYQKGIKKAIEISNNVYSESSPWNMGIVISKKELIEKLNQEVKNGN